MELSPKTHSGIYQILNLANGRCYIGSAVRVEKRWKEHRRGLESGKHHSRFMQRAWGKYGQESFAFRTLIYCDRKDLLFYEQLAIDAYKPDYNSAPTAGSQLGYKMTDEAKAKMSASRRKDFSPMTGKKHSDETKAKISASRMGKGGGYRSPERRAKISAALKGRVITVEQRIKISAKLTGLKQTPETIEKRAVKLRGRKMPVGFAEKARMWMLGRKMAASACVNIGRAKASLSDDQVVDIRIRRAAGEMRKDLAKEFKVDAASITNIVARKSYAWVK